MVISVYGWLWDGNGWLWVLTGRYRVVTVSYKQITWPRVVTCGLGWLQVVRGG